MNGTTRTSLMLAVLSIAAFALLIASPSQAMASSGEISRAEANADWTQGSITGTASWGGGCATAAPCRFQPYVTVGTSECSSSERRWPHSNAQLALAWSGAEQAGGGSASFDVSEVALSGESGQLACLALLETYEERPDCQLHPQPGTACPMYIVDVQNSSVLASAPLSVPSSGPPVTSPPTIESESASHITATDATLEAQIDPNGQDTRYEFQLDTNGGYDYTRPACPLGACEAIIVGEPLSPGLVEPSPESIPAATGEQSVSLDLASIGATLQPGTTYHYRVIASNGGPVVTGPDQTFSTPSQPPGPIPLGIQSAGAGADPSSAGQAPLTASGSPPRKPQRKHKRGPHPRKAHHTRHAG